jgi:hypothetical protein
VVGYAELRDARPQMWRAAADDWLALAKEAERAAEDVYQRASGPLPANWTDPAGDSATKRLVHLADDYQAAAGILRGVANTLDGVADSIESLQCALRIEVDDADCHGFAVLSDGRVAALHGACSDDEARYIAEASQRITETLQSATRVDEAASRELTTLAGHAGDHDSYSAVNRVLAEASRGQLDLLRASLPVGGDRAFVRAWWAALSPQQRLDLERALPVELYDLDGIPDDVKAALRGSVGYDRVEMVRWARANWDNTKIDIFDVNCANFVSSALAEAGLPYKMDPVTGTWASDSWGRGPQAGWDWLDTHNGSHTDSWSQARTQRDFFLSNGGATIPLAEARPGDIIYWTHTGPTGPAHVYHASVVTAVTPDGDVRYTQHTDPYLDVSLGGKLSYLRPTNPSTQATVVRPRQTWAPPFQLM